MTMQFRRSAVLPNTALVRVLGHLMGDWTPEKCGGYLDTMIVPSQWIDKVVDYIRDKPDLWFVGEDEFVESAVAASPVLAPLLRTPRFRLWLRKASGDLRIRMPGLMIRQLFGGA